MECEFYINYVICESAVALAEKINADGVLYKLCDMWICKKIYKENRK